MIKSQLQKLLTIGIPYVMFFISPIVPMLLFVGFLVMADLFTGTKAAIKRGEIIHSKGLARSVSKITLYFIAILLSRGMEVVFFENIPVTSLTAGYIALAEFKSNLENIGEYTGTDIWNYIKEKFTR
jgi:phage-related holin